MVRKSWAQKMQSMATLLRGYGFVVNPTNTGFVGCHANGHTVTCNEKRLKWESVDPTVEGFGAVTQARIVPPCAEMLATKCQATFG
jgi:hypothetical protein